MYGGRDIKVSKPEGGGEWGVGWEVVDPVVEARFAPSEGDLSSCREMARNLSARLRGS